MPLTKTGKEVLKKMQNRYGMKSGNKVFYASINDKKPGTKKWHEESMGEKYHKAMEGK